MRLFVPLTREEFERLSTLAQVERRRPQDQAAILLSRSLITLHPEPTTEANQKEVRGEPERTAR